MPSHTIPPELLEAMVQSEAKVREQRRVTQQRYRKKMDQRTKSLENDTLRLQEETHRLELQYNCLISQTPTEETPWSVVAEYYRLFRYGSQVPESTKQALYLNEAQIQTNFLHRTMAQTISVNSGFGIDALLQEWRFVPPMAGDLTVQLLRLEYDDRAAMLATVKVFVTITEDMLRLSFSHLVSTDNRLSPFAEKLLREKIVVPVTVRFEWDNTTAQVVSMHSTPDLFTPFTKVLGNLKDAARVLVNSRLAVALGAAS
ncbi:hypothetical protein JG688_00012271 [Phytophthora aleatoria]|uniref:Bzip transcription factor n=1 Tax=Phytophthora aleatoria TaxID=2496075 RepID=A0A8J5M4R1_9STRA|nr:hypothetical protein JG688_00012271 [Phytophthora aleatoria]